MTPEERSLLERTYKMTEDNNAMLRSIRRSSRISNIMRGIYWGVIILLSFGAYYFIQPYVNTMLGLFNQSGSNVNSGQSSVDLLKDLLK
jgi:hypothetical protein